MLNIFKKKKEKYLILDIGSQNTKMGIFYPEKTMIENLIVRPTPPDSFQKGSLSSKNNLGEFIAQCGEELGVEKELNVIAGLSGKGIIAKKIDIPKMDESMIPEFVEIEVEQELFYNKDEMELDYEILPDVNLSKTNAQPLLVITVLKSLIENYNNIVQEAQLNSKILDTNFSALFNSFEHNEEPDKNSNYMVLDIGCSVTNLLVVIKSQLVFVRSLPVGGQFFNDKITQELGVDNEEAEELKISASRGENAPQQLVDLIKGTINGTYVEEIQSCYELYCSLFPGNQVSQIYITGGASQTLELQPFLQEKMAIPVSLLNPFQNIKLSLDIENQQEDLKVFSAVVSGLALRSIYD